MTTLSKTKKEENTRKSLANQGRRAIDAPTKKNQGRLAGGHHIPPYRPPAFALQSLDLARHGSFMRSAPANYPRQCHVSFSNTWNIMALLLHNLRTYGQNVFWGPSAPELT